MPGLETLIWKKQMEEASCLDFRRLEMRKDNCSRTLAERSPGKGLRGIPSVPMGDTSKELYFIETTMLVIVLITS